MAHYTYDFDVLEKHITYFVHPQYDDIHIMQLEIHIPDAINRDQDTITLNNLHNYYVPEVAIPTVYADVTPLIGDRVTGYVSVDDYVDEKNGIKITMQLGNWEWDVVRYRKTFTLFQYYGRYQNYKNEAVPFIATLPSIYDKNGDYISLQDPSEYLWMEINNRAFTFSTGAPNYNKFPSAISTGSISVNDGTLEDLRWKPLSSSFTHRAYNLGKITSGHAFKDPDNPYDGGDDPGDDDNTPGDYDHKSDPVPEPDLPTVSVTDSGLVTLFAPTQSQLKSLANYLWSDAFSLDSFKKMLNNPMDCILGLTIVPVNVPRGSAREITVGNIVTTVSCDICSTQYVKVDCGTFTFNRHDMTNSYLDYSPYSKCYLYLPFIGVQEINIDDFMQSTMHVVYHVDILTGAMFCYVMRGKSVMYTYMGQCAENVPLSSSSYSNTIGSIMSAAASIVGVASVAATGGASAPVAAGLLTGATTSTANAVTSLKPSVAHSGSIGGGAGIMGVNYPYLIFNTPHVSIPSQQRHYTGYPSNQIVKLSALKGFNIIQAINLSVSGANDAEMNEIESILKGGVIL